MKVLDASVVTDAVAVKGRGGDLARRLVAAEARLHAPAILNAEVASALRAMLRRGDLRAGEARAAALRAIAIRARRYAFEPFVARVWELRDNVTVYDAWYVALAETLEVPLVSADDRLRRSDGPRCPVLSPLEAVEAS
ncbi:MAG: type II toxin-antitoxin system VapC family toxin [Actinobacteria bacterium]|nr:type II toxin-antitoxin system VapC family toxin [Actinomycetota bacterium]